MVKKHIAPGGFPFAENAILEGLEGDEYMRRTIEEIQQSTAKMRAKRESSMAHEIAKIRMRQDAVAARRGPPPRRLTSSPRVSGAISCQGGRVIAPRDQHVFGSEADRRSVQFKYSRPDR